MKGITLILNYLLGSASMKLIEIEKELNLEFDKVFDNQELLYLMLIFLLFS